MVEEIFRADAYLTACVATVVAASPSGIALDRTVFYPTGGGQPGDSGRLARADGAQLVIADTVKGAEDGSILHVPAPDQPASLAVGDVVTARLDWPRRYAHMRVHTTLHLLCAIIPAGVTGGQVGAGKGRLDFDLATVDGDVTLDRADIEARLNALIAGDHEVAARWIDDAELAARPELVRTMSVKPPSGRGRVRLLEIAGVDLQPCGGTHVRRTGEIGRVTVDKIENKGRRNRRVSVSLSD